MKNVKNSRNPIKFMGVVLIVIGIGALIYQAFLGHSPVNASDLGPAEAFIQDPQTNFVPLIVGLFALIDGTALMVFFRGYRSV